MQRAEEPRTRMQLGLRVYRPRWRPPPSNTLVLVLVITAHPPFRKPTGTIGKEWWPNS